MEHAWLIPPVAIVLAMWLVDVWQKDVRRRK